MQIPDAPWIREAENDGMPSAEPVHCPCCGKECETFFVEYKIGSDVLGCEHCITTKDAQEWADEHRDVYIENT